MGGSLAAMGEFVGMTMSEPPRSFDVKVTPEAHFSWVRTRLSLERTLMSWVRTATALIGFGFSIVQFFDRLNQTPHVKAALHPNLPRHLGLALMALGSVALAIAIWQYRTVVRYLDGGPFAAIAARADSPWRTPVLFVAGMLILVGMTAFASVIVRSP